MTTLSGNPNDIPFAALYRFDSDQNRLMLECTCAIAKAIEGVSPYTVSVARGSFDRGTSTHVNSNSSVEESAAQLFARTVSEVQRSGIAREMSLQQARAAFGAQLGTFAPWNDTPRSVMILPLSSQAVLRIPSSM